MFKTYVTTEKLYLFSFIHMRNQIPHASNVDRLYLYTHYDLTSEWSGSFIASSNAMRKCIVNISVSGSFLYSTQSFYFQHIYCTKCNE
jgi:hypothetical protein